MINKIFIIIRIIQLKWKGILYKDRIRFSFSEKHFMINERMCIIIIIIIEDDDETEKTNLNKIE